MPGRGGSGFNACARRDPRPVPAAGLSDSALSAARRPAAAVPSARQVGAAAAYVWRHVRGVPRLSALGPCYCAALTGSDGTAKLWLPDEHSEPVKFVKLRLFFNGCCAQKLSANRMRNKLSVVNLLGKSF